MNLNDQLRKMIRLSVFCVWFITSVSSFRFRFTLTLGLSPYNLCTWALYMGPLCPIIWYQLRGALFLAKVPHDLQTELLMSSRFKKIKPDMNFSFSLKSPSKRTTSFFSNRAPMERATCLQGLFYIHLKFLTIISLNIEIFPFCQTP